MSLSTVTIASQTTEYRRRAPTIAQADQVMIKARGLIERGEFSIALDLMQPYIPYLERFPALYSDYLVILVWADRRKEAIKRFESLPAHFGINSAGVKALQQRKEITWSGLYDDIQRDEK